MGASVRKMKELSAAVSRLNLQEQEKRVEENRKLLEYTPKKAEKQKREAKGDKTIYDDRKNLSNWQVHLSKTYRDMKKKNPKATFQAAMKAAKKTYKKKSK